MHLNTSAGSILWRLLLLGVWCGMFSSQLRQLAGNDQHPHPCPFSAGFGFFPHLPGNEVPLREQKNTFLEKKPIGNRKHLSGNRRFGAQGNLWQLGIKEKPRAVFQCMRKWPPFKRKTRPKVKAFLGWFFFFWGIYSSPNVFFKCMIEIRFPCWKCFLLIMLPGFLTPNSRKKLSGTNLIDVESLVS